MECDWGNAVCAGEGRSRRQATRMCETGWRVRAIAHMQQKVFAAMTKGKSSTGEAHRRKTLQDTRQCWCLLFSDSASFCRITPAAEGAARRNCGVSRYCSHTIHRYSAYAVSAPIRCATMNSGASIMRMPAKVSDSERANVTARLLIYCYGNRITTAPRLAACRT